MEKTKSEAFNLKVLAFGVVLVTLYVSKNPTMDPVNVSKMLIASALGFFFWFDALSYRLKYLWQNFKTASIISVFLLTSSLISLLFGQVPIVQNFYGVFGRNTGFLTYFSLLGIFLGVLAIQSSRLPEFLVKGLLFSGFVNVIYCLVVILGYDFFKWNNIYGRILGTFGNPDFISAFLGMYVVTVLASLKSTQIRMSHKIICGISIPIAIFEILKSHAIQGVIILVFGTALVSVFYVREKFQNKLVMGGYLASLFICGFVALAGALQKGPLAQYIYKASVSLRGVYWNVGIEIGNSNLLTGVGFDGYGDFYREFRGEKAMVTPGPKIVTNAAHNVFIDFYTSGGLPLLLCYIAFVLTGAYSIIRVFVTHKKFDPLFVALATAWACYYLQSIVSINQIGLAIWGWVLNGAVISYATLYLKSDKTLSAEKERGRSVVIANPTMKFAGILGLLIGTIIALPPFIRDIGWVSALNSQNAQNIAKAAAVWPMDIQRTNNIGLFLEQNKASALAHDVILQGLDFNKRSFDGWRLLYVIQTTPENEKQIALEKMKSLDPLNLKFE